MVKFNNVFFSYRNMQIIKDVKLDIRSGSYTCIIGKNGSGKSTISKLIAGLLLPQKGEALVNGFNILEKKDFQNIRKSVGIIFQNPEDQIVTTTVIDEIIFGLENIGAPREQMLTRAYEALESVELLHLKNRQTHQLSGGQKQRLAIASILAMDAKLIIFDESTAMLDPNGRKQILSIMCRLHSEGKTIIHITHDMEEVLEAQYVVVLKEGRAVYQGTSKGLFNNLSIIRENELSLPFIYKFKNLLIQQGVNVPSTAETIDELVRLI